VIGKLYVPIGVELLVVTVPTTVTGLPFNVTEPGIETPTPAAPFADPANVTVPLNRIRTTKPI